MTLPEGIFAVVLAIIAFVCVGVATHNERTRLALPDKRPTCDEPISKVKYDAICAATDRAETVIRKGDAAVPNQLNFQTPATAIMEKIVDLHHDLMFFIIAIVVFVS